MNNVLLVEDDKFLSDLYGDALKKAGFKVDIVNDAQAALDKLDDRQTDVLVLDVYLPVNNAFEIIQQLQSYPDWQDLPVILISSHQLGGSKLPKKLRQQLSIADFLYKPDMLPGDLVESVKAAL